MKTFKLTILSLAMILFVFTACTNNEPVIEEQQTTEESESITTTLDQLRAQFDDNGNVSQFNNPAGNIVLDFCFDFVYPLTLAYNNGTTVSISDLDGLIDIMLNSNDNLFINGIAFPFNVEIYNESTNSIEIATITNESEFTSLIESCDFNTTGPCECFEVYDPVCVEITNPNGDTFIVTYSNECFAACDGFTSDDFVENCEEDYNSTNNQCFSLNFPVSIIIDGNTTVEVNSEAELNTALYDVYDFDFIYPISVTLENGNIVDVTSSEELENIITNCFGCPCPANVDPVCVEVIDTSGNILTISYNNACLALCDGYTEADFVACNSGNPLCLPSAITTALVENSGWTVSNINGSQDLNGYEISFNADGSLQWTSDGNTFSGTWSAVENPISGNMLSLSFSGPDLQQATGQWMVVDCDLPCSISLLLTNGDVMELSRSCN
ncbi:hypothetical protein [Winogradskyella sp. 4-2091]|uniref:hypothetical protein n=1 Tax=Winogradskyella sp. 4-2091 TaxID=3381659 RepID=UPI003891F7F7